MKKYLLALTLSIAASTSYSQKITNIVMFTLGGAVTEDPSIASDFAVIKQYDDTLFERLDYVRNAPLTKVRHYKSEALSVLHGSYYEYHTNGRISVSGNYFDNKKEGNWRIYNDTGKTMSSINYINDSIFEVEDLDKEKDTTSFGDEKEASYPGGQKAWKNYLVKRLLASDAVERSYKGGTVFVDFRIDTDGTVENVYITRSVEYILDEFSLDIIRSSQKWKPAFQNGKYVKAYRRQPLTFAKPLDF